MSRVIKKVFPELQLKSSSSVRRGLASFLLSVLAGSALLTGTTVANASGLCEFISGNHWASFDSVPKINVTEKPKTADDFFNLAVKRYFDNLYDSRVTQADISYKNYLQQQLNKTDAVTDDVARQIKKKIIELDGRVFDKEIKDFFLAAAEKGHKESQFCLGRIYEYGVGVDISYVDSYSWYAVAASASTPGGEALMWGVSQRLERTEFSQAEKKAQNYIKQYAGK